MCNGNHIKESKRAEIGSGEGIKETKHNTENSHPSTKITELEEGTETDKEN